MSEFVDIVPRQIVEHAGLLNDSTVKERYELREALALITNFPYVSLRPIKRFSVGEFLLGLRRSISLEAVSWIRSLI